MELLALLAYVDWPLWKTFARELWPHHHLDWLDEFEARPHPLGVQIGGDCSDDVYEMLATACEEDDPRSSAAYKKAKRVFLGELAMRGTTIDELPVEVNCGCREDVGDAAERFTQALNQQRVRRLQATEAAARSHQTKSRYAGLHVRYVHAQTNQASGLALAAAAAAAGATVHHVYSGDLKFVQQQPRDYMDAMSQLLPSAASISESPLRGVGSLDLWTQGDTDSFPAVVSAIAASECVRSICFINEFVCLHGKNVYSTEERAHLCRLWSWMGHGLFTKPFGDRGHGVRRLEIDTSTLEQFTVDAVASVLRARNPVALLYGHQSSNQPPEVVSASRFALHNPMAATGSDDDFKWSSGELLENLPVIFRMADWVCVLLPRWGQAWVHREEVVKAHPFDDAGTIQKHSIPQVSLTNIDATSAHHAAPLLRLIGQRIERLAVSSRCNELVWGDDPSHFDALCHQAFTTCSMLKEFQVSFTTGSHANLQTLLDAYASGTCRLEEIDLTGANFVDARDSLKRFLGALTDRQHPARQHLRKLRVSYVPLNIAMDAAVVSSCVAMADTK